MTQQELLIKFARQTITPEEATLFRERFRQLTPHERRALESEYALICARYANYGPIHEDWKAEMLQRVQGWEGVEFALKRTPPPTADLKSAASLSTTLSSYDTIPVHRIHLLKTAWFRWAAILLLIAGSVVYLFRYHRSTHQIAGTPTDSIAAPDIQPGGNKAVLTLADGSRISLDTAADGKLAQQGNTRVSKLNAGSLAYSAGTAGGDLLYNTVSTPKGGQYQITLPDGTKVWLNAASSITFPTAFTGNDRKILVTGEVFLEVAPAKTRPFYVTAAKTTIEVLGTSFNINLYDDEPAIRTTLIQGSIRIRAGGTASLLAPGQQSSFNKFNQRDVINNANLEEVLAWKNNTFYFNRTNLADAMRQIARWYDVEVEYEHGLPDVKLMGDIKRDLTLSQVLKGLNKMGVKFRMEGKKLMVE